MAEKLFGRRDLRIELIAATYLSSILALICVGIYLGAVLRLEPRQWIITPIVAVLMFGVFAAIYVLRILSMASEILEYKRKGNAVRVVELSFSLPWKAGKLAFITWMVGGLFVAIMLVVTADYTFTEALMAYYGAILGGVVGPVFAYFFFRMVIKAHIREEIKQFYMEMKGEYPPGEPIRLRRKLMIPFTLLVALVLGFLSIVSYVLARDSVLRNVKNLGLAKLSLLAKDDEGVKYLEEEGWRPFYLNGAKSNSKLSSAVLSVLNSAPPGPGAHVDYRTGNVYLWIKKGEAIKGVYYPWERINKRDLRKIGAISVSVIIFSLLVVSAVAWFVSKDISDTITEMKEGMKKITIGDVDVSVQVLSDDEMQEAIGGFVALHNRLKKVVTAIHELSTRISERAVRVEDVYNQAITRLSKSLEFSRKSLADLSALKKNMDELKKNTEISSRSVDEISSSAIEMESNIRSVFDIIGDFMDRVSRSIELMEHVHAEIENLRSFLKDTSSAASAEMDTVNSLEESLKEVEAHIRESHAKALQVMENAEKGSETIMETIDIIRTIKAFVNQMMEVIERLLSHSKEVGNILSLIDDLADETNLLSLNASIIAAQAGEHGRAFAVVADQVRELSERTSISTRDVRRILEDIMAATRNAREMMEKGNKQVEEGVQRVTTMEQMFRKIMESSREAASIAGEVLKFSSSQVGAVSSSLERLTTVMKLMSDASAAIEDLSTNAQTLHQDNQYMKSMIEKVINASVEQEKGGKVIAQNIENIADMIKFLDQTLQNEIKLASSLLSSGQGTEQEINRALEDVRRIKETLSEIAAEASALAEQTAFGRKDEEEG